MKRFKSILVGVDLAQGDVLVSENLVPLTEEAVAWALWLAKTNSARLFFFHVLPSRALNLDAETQMLLEEDHAKRTVKDHATEVLAKIAESARKEGLAAESLVVHGKSWVEMIRQVLRENHDLVIVGTRHLDPVKSFLVGSTGIKMLRKCPCPVWVTQPQPDRRIASILVAHDLQPVGDLAMELGCSMAELHDARLHVLHAAEYPAFDSILPAEYHRDAEQHIAAQLGKFELAQPAQVHVVAVSPDFAILNHIEQHSIELLVVGTVARAGISGVFTGNTAERLLPRIPCSVLAVKLTGFKSPVTLDEHRVQRIGERADEPLPCE
jgi:universal stress protein E